MTKSERELVAAMMRNMARAVEFSWQHREKLCTQSMEEAMEIAKSLVLEVDQS